MLATFLMLFIGEVFGQYTPPPWLAEATCILEYTVTKTGTTADIVLVGCGNEEDTKAFGAAAVNAGGKYIYKPKIVHGVAVETKGVRIKIEFRKEADTDIEINNDIKTNIEDDYIKQSDIIQPPK